MPIHQLPHAIYLFIMDYLEYSSQVFCTCSCKDWYEGLMRQYVRKICIQNSERDKNEMVVTRLGNLIQFPKQQLRIIWNRFWNESSFVNLLLKHSNFKLRELNCSIATLLSLGTLTVESLLLEIKNSQFRCMLAPELSSTFIHLETSIHSLKSLTMNVYNHSIQFPHIPTLQQLTIYNNLHEEPILPQYLSQLRSLSLCGCNISDVRGFGLIPELCLNNCKNIRDVRDLNDNTRIEIVYCPNLFEITDCFQRSREIKVITSSPIELDLTSWQRVKTLTLGDSCRLSSCHVFKKSIVLPLSVIRCTLLGSFVTSIDLTRSLSAPRWMQELHLGGNDALKSLELLGLERVHYIECFDLRNLQNLKGLGEGMNQRIFIRDCEEIVDLSPLKNVCDVTLANVSFTGQIMSRSPKPNSVLSTAGNIRWLTLRIRDSLGIPSSIQLQSCLEYLDISGSGPISSFEGLEKIAVIKLSCDQLKVLFFFLSNGGNLANYRIDIIGIVTGWEKMYEEYMISEYLISSVGNRCVSFVRRKVV